MNKSTTLIFGGSFNPPHQGHVDAVQGLFETQGLSIERVFVLPSFGTPLKNVGISFEHRFEMTKIAFESQKFAKQITVSNFEAVEKTQFTWQVLEGLAPKLNAAAFVIGTDQFEKLDQWARYPEVLGMSDWIVLLRKPKKLSDLTHSLKKFSNAGWLHATTDQSQYKIKVGGQIRNLTLLETEAKEIASTEVRALFARGKMDEAKAIIPEKVFEYIERNHLYGT